MIFMCTRDRSKTEGRLHLSTEGYLFFYQYYHDKKKKKQPSLLFFALYYCCKFDKLLLSVRLEFRTELRFVFMRLICFSFKLALTRFSSNVKLDPHFPLTGISCGHFAE